MSTHIRNPVEWTLGLMSSAAHNAEDAGRLVRGTEAGQPTVTRITTSDIRDALAKGFEDFMSCRTDVVLLCLIYPVVGLVLARVMFGYDMLPLLFPLASGFALVGPVAAVGFYEMSRRRANGFAVSWADAFGVAVSPRIGAIVLLGLVLMAIFLVWLVTAQAIYAATLGPQAPASIGAFVSDVFGTPAGWTMIAVGLGVGFLFAVLVLAISVVSLPLLVDRDIGLAAAVVTSVRAVIANPGPMALWGIVVAAGLVAGSIPALLGLAIALPILGHATWHLYRKVVVAD